MFQAQFGIVRRKSRDKIRRKKQIQVKNQNFLHMINPYREKVTARSTGTYQGASRTLLMSSTAEASSLASAMMRTTGSVFEGRTCTQAS